MKRYLMSDGSISSYPDDCVIFEVDHPIRAAQEITESEYLEQMEARKPKPKELGYQDKRRAEYPDWHELADAIVEERLGRPEKMLEYMAAVSEVKQKYPKEN